MVLEGAGHMAMLERPIELDREIRLFAIAALGLDAPHPPRRKRKAAKGEG